MPDPNYVMWIALAIAGVAIVLMWLVGRSAKPQPAAGEAAPAPGLGTHDHLLLRFVTDEAGQRRAETVAAEGDRIVLKQGDAFFLVPADKLQDAGGALRLPADFDWEAARGQGDEWRRRSHKEITYAPEEVPRDEP